MQLDLCRHIKTNGLQCHGVSLAATAELYPYSSAYAPPRFDLSG